MNFWSQFKFTSKGPHSLGGNNSNNIGIKYRGLHPSMLGQVDVLVCGNSDPGTSGLLSPFAKIDGLYFNSEDEPDDFYFQLMKDLEKKYEGTNIKFIKCDFESSKDFYKALKDMQKYADENISISGTSRAGHYELVINEEGDMDDTTKPSTIALAKKKKKKPEEETEASVEAEVEEEVSEEE